VVAHCGWAGENHLVIGSPEEVQSVLNTPVPKACIAAQTTIKRTLFTDVCEKVREKVDDLQVFDSICGATDARQREAVQLAKASDVVFVIGGRNSANTAKLYETCSAYCSRCFHIEEAREIPFTQIKKGDLISITAGASVPDEIIKEVVTVMSEFDITQGNVVEPEQQQEESSQDVNFMAEYEKTMVQIRNGQTVTGTIVQITENEVCVNIGYKSDGIIPRAELLSFEGDIADSFKVGDEIEAEVVKVNDGEGNVLLSQKNILVKKNWDVVVAKYEAGELVEGTGKNAVKGGLIADVMGIRTFVPASQLAERFVEKISDFVGTTFKLKIVELDKQKRSVVASRRQALQIETSAQKATLLETLKVGSVVKGTVRRLTDFGAFVDVGGIDGLVHVTDLSWGRVKHPRDIVKPGDEIDVLILSIDRERERVSLGYKQTQPKPWDRALETYPVGSIVKGVVVRMATFGAFIELEPGLDGLVHISQIANERVNKVEDKLTIGQEVNVRVLDVNPENHRISLSIRDALDFYQYEEQMQPLDDLGDITLADISAPIPTPAAVEPAAVQAEEPAQVTEPEPVQAEEAPEA
jgi:4-hydroxy-3-methylbut-2-enyl diphosphate reductase